MAEILKLIEKKIIEGAIVFYRDHFDERQYYPKKYRKMPGLRPVGKFDPFLSSRKDDNGKIWSRDADLARLKEHLATHEKSHLILAGASGVGKTVFLTRIVQPAFGANVHLIARYNNFLSDLINSMPCEGALADRRLDLSNLLVSYTKTAPEITIGRVLQERESIVRADERLNKLTAEIESFIVDALNGKPITIFIFDQIERFLVDIKHRIARSVRTPLAYEVYFLITVLRAMRKTPNVRTIFSIRSDALYASVDFLSYSLDQPSDADHIFKYMYLYGISVKSADAGVMKDIQEKFASANASTSWNDIATFLSLQSRSVANTFFVQVTGYLVEHFSETEPRIKKVIKDGESPRDLLPILFDQLIAGFLKYQRAAASEEETSKVSYDMLRLIVLTIAIENKATGDPITRERIALLAHVPRSYVNAVIGYLLDAGVIQRDANEEEAVRFAHDMLFEHIVHDDAFVIRDDLQKSVERLSERRIADVRPLRDFAHLWSDARKADVGALAVVFLLAYGAVISLTAWDSTIFSI